MYTPDYYPRRGLRIVSYFGPFTTQSGWGGKQKRWAPWECSWGFPWELFAYVVSTGMSRLVWLFLRCLGDVFTTMVVVKHTTATARLLLLCPRVWFRQSTQIEDDGQCKHMFSRPFTGARIVPGTAAVFETAAWRAKRVHGHGRGICVSIRLPPCVVLHQDLACLPHTVPWNPRRARLAAGGCYDKPDADLKEIAYRYQRSTPCRSISARERGGER